MKRSHHFSSGQGATEYLVVLGVVLIIGLVSVSLLSYFPGTAADTSSNAAKTYWQGAARPLRVVEATQTNETTLTFVLENAEADSMKLIGVGLGDASVQFAEGAYLVSNASAINFGPGERKLVSVDFSSTQCMRGKLKSLLLSFSYQTDFGTALVETSDKQLAVQCNYDSTGSVGQMGGNGSNSSALQIITSSIPNIYPDETFSTRLNATGGSPPYSWSRTSGQILTVWSNGGVYRWYTGTLQVGSYPQEIVVTDSAGTNASRTIGFGVLEMPVAPCGSGGGSHSLVANPQPARFCQGSNWTVQAPIVNGGVPPYSYSANSQTMPPGFAVVSCQPGDDRICIRETGQHAFTDGATDYVDVCVTDSEGTSVSSIVVIDYYNC